MKLLLHTRLIVLVLLINTVTSQAQNNVGIGTTTPNSKAILELKATDKGFMAPRMNTTQMLAIAPTATESALLIYNIDSACYHFYNGTAWKNLCDKSIDTALLNKAIKNYLNSNSTTIINILKGDTALFNYTNINNAVINILKVDTSITNVAIINNAIINTLTVDSSNTNYANINNANIDSSKTNYAYIKNGQIDTLKSTSITTNSITANTFNGGFSNMDSLYIGGQNIMQTMTDSIAAQAWLLKGNNASATNKLGTLNARDLHIVANSAEKITILSGTGYVGINQPLPSQPLDVTGNIRFTGALMPNTLAGTTGQVLTSAGTGVAPTWTSINNVSSASITDSIKVQAWLLKGNAGTNWATNFMGTTNNTSLRFRTNNTEQMIIDSLGNVGIGTTIPLTKLHIVGGDIFTDFTNNTANTIDPYNIQGLRITNFSTLNNTEAGISFNNSVVGGAAAGIFGRGYGSDNMDLHFWTENGSGRSNKMIITNNGDVGIGTAIPLTKLYVSETNSALRSVASFENIGRDRRLDIVNELAADAPDHWLGLNARASTSAIGRNFVIQTGGIERFRIQDVTGNVGIGTATPVARFNVSTDGTSKSLYDSNEQFQFHGNSQMYGTVSSDFQTFGFGVNGLAGSTAMQDGAWIGSLTNDRLNFRTNNAERMVINNVGNVGIGVTNPTSKLTVNGVFTSTWGMAVNTEFISGNWQNVGAGYAGLVQHDISSGNMIFWTSPASAAAGVSNPINNRVMDLTATGNVGINTPTPTEKLEVNGSIKITDGTQGAGKVLTSDATGKASWVESAVSTNKYSYNLPYPATVAVPTPGLAITLGAPFVVATKGIYRVLVDATLPAGMILGIDGASVTQSVLYSTASNRYYSQYFVYITAGTHSLILYNDANTALTNCGPYWRFDIEGPLN